MASKHPQWKNPYVCVEYITEEEADITPFFDGFWNKYEGLLPFVIDPSNLDAAHMFPVPAKVRTELGDKYCYNCSPYKIIYDLHMGRMQAAQGDERRNFGVKRWKMMSPENEQVVVDFVRHVEGSATWRVIIAANVSTATFTSNEDVDSIV